ncbi:hypothetical protein KC686_00400 [Candidatus Woesebacteria bacterium]|nr:hypothetical protein [Candidatus Woesebacteria bacterium]
MNVQQTNTSKPQPPLYGDASGPTVQTEKVVKNSKKPPSKKKVLQLIVGFVFFMLLVGGSSVGLYLAQQQQDVRNQAAADLCANITNNVIGTISKPIIENTGRALATVQNTSTDCTHELSLMAFEVYDDMQDPNWLNTQVLFDSSTATIAPGETLILDVRLPSCNYQIDLAEGKPLVPPDYRSSSLHLFDFAFGGAALCGAPSTPTPSPQVSSAPLTCNSVCQQADKDQCTASMGPEYSCVMTDGSRTGRCRRTSNPSSEKCEAPTIVSPSPSSTTPQCNSTCTPESANVKDTCVLSMGSAYECTVITNANLEIKDEYRCRLKTNPTSTTCQAPASNEPIVCNSVCDPLADKCGEAVGEGHACINTATGTNRAQYRCRRETNPTSSTCSLPTSVSPSPSVSPSVSPSISPSPSPTPTYTCNSTCTGDSQCHSANASYVCYKEGSNTTGVCRMGNNPSNTSCQAAQGTYACNSTCSADAQCQTIGSGYICHEGACRMSAYPTQTNCQAPVVAQQPVYQTPTPAQPVLPEELPQTGAFDFSLVAKIGVATLALGAALLLLL